ncbi:FecR domain-containing protein [Methylomicrobium sp. Wu6]|uniref:FecR family protein n=1 Tax=Methylomicrobium sp. Wu6 TaxID=3107928 RepID=UPI002DD68C05|nr:FecR domain-containing protein [Methylomicrobium sp. Wu6]MEC4748522.1 FecR domain-containing protein [Methylomicrobium sp. Wu6]
MNSPTHNALSEPQRQALRWLSRLRDNACSDQDRHAFEDWLATAPEHAEAYVQAQQFWQQLGGLTDAAGARLKDARGYAQKAQAARRRRNTTLLALALAVSLCVLQPQLALKLTAERYQTAKGEQTAIDLADGSRIELNTDSDLRVARLFGARTVWLERGEAWFDVEHDAAHPFEVVVGNGRIRDVGTRFNVINDLGSTAVEVTEGEVALCPDAGPEQSVKAGQQSGFDAEGRLRPVTAGDANAAGSWRQGLLIFRRQTLPEVLRQLARYHRVEFELPDAKLHTLEVSGRFSTSDLDESLHTLANGLGVKVTRLSPTRIVLGANR